MKTEHGASEPATFLRRPWLSLLLVGVIFAVACGPANPLSKEGKYLGDWQNIKSSGRWAKIYKTGDTYIWEDNEGKYPATFREGQLKVSGPFGEIAVAYVDTSDHLIVLGDEYERKKK